MHLRPLCIPGSNWMREICQDRPRLSLPMCRTRIRSNILYQAAQSLLAENLVESFAAFERSLRLAKKNRRHQLITPILLQNRFEVIANESALFNRHCVSIRTGRARLPRVLRDGSSITSHLALGYSPIDGVILKRTMRICQVLQNSQADWSSPFIRLQISTQRRIWYLLANE